ncbi:phenylalanine--tRNA ligase subunit alpha [Marinigracilibium pacificum]|uniref:Phenylalanine--tRNA ligase alpha subunit n=1 Tax=Marinigracilibium pacificum TaxID=2729599 RepID=A0A848J0N7_9BACT|nr:phenylalanine--tRNA ligase subunit alpha [Marinigracilibium pacificum]NMM46812.1 phenylalanine--tRNA ligase subunit alpha [Marinigracilibium pacificum]
MENIEALKEEIKSFKVENENQLEEYRLKFIGRKNIINDLFTQLKDIPNDQKKAFGLAVNELKNLAKDTFQGHIDNLNGNKTGGEQAFDFDPTLPVAPNQTGGLHPLTIVRNRIIEIFERIGFKVADGPEIEDDWHNFTALNFPPNHPAREMQDTFFIERDPDIALRTHTSSVQVRLMESEKPPIRALMPGRVFRNEAISARAHCVFHQIEGLYIDENVGLTDLKQTLYHFAKELFGPETKVRFRPSYFPFTEPSAEMDVSCNICKGKGCNVCKYTGWLEILGSGMVDPNVLENCGIDSEKYTGFAFGMGIERLAMLKYNVKDLRLFTENDIRFLRQFKGAE